MCTTGVNGDTGACVLGFASDGGATRHLSVNFAAGGQIQLRRGVSSGTVIATSTYAPVVGAWVYYEMQATIADSGGTCVLKADGVEIINYSGDTRNAGTSTDIDAVVIAGSSGGTEAFDDLYVLNTAGSAPYNTYLGDVKIETLVPNGNGATSQWVGSDGNSTDNYLLVDDPTANTSDYTSSPTVGERDLYTMSDLVTTSGTVLAVQPLAYVQKSDANSASVKALLRSSGGTVVASPARVLSTSWTMVAGDLRTTDPDGAGWTIASVNGLQSGVETA